MSHLILKTSLTPAQLLHHFQSLKVSDPIFVRAWIAKNEQELLLELHWHANSETRTEYLSIQQQSTGQLILHSLGSENIPKAVLQAVIHKLWQWWKMLDTQAQIVKHTLGSHADLS